MAFGIRTIIDSINHQINHQTINKSHLYSQPRFLLFLYVSHSKKSKPIYLITTMFEMQRFLPPQTDSNESPVARGICRRRLPMMAASYALTELELASLFPLAPRARGHVGAVPGAVTLSRRQSKPCFASSIILAPCR